MIVKQNLNKVFMKKKFTKKIYTHFSYISESI